MEVTNLDNAAPFIAMDGSEIRELLAHRNSAIRNQSLAEARLPVGGTTLEHYHVQTEEIYYITHGSGQIRIEGELRDVAAGDPCVARCRANPRRQDSDRGRLPRTVGPEQPEELAFLDGEVEAH